MLTFLKEYSRASVKGKIPALSSFRYYKKWNDLRDQSPLVSRQPWLTFQAIDFIESNIHNIDKVFEYGGGASTLYFLGKTKELVTVEHDPEWFQLLQEKVGISDKAKWQGQLILPEKGVNTANLDKAKPADYYTEASMFANNTFKEYSTFISRFEDGYFDLVLIDGRARTSCLYHAIPKVRVGGFLVLDNAERKYYLQHNAAILNESYRLLLNDMGPVPYSPHFSQTAIWQRIK